MQSKTGITKKEFLVLIGCIAVLLFSLGAVGRTGRSRAREMVCNSYVKQLIQAWLKYTEDNDGCLVGGHPSRETDAWVKNPRGIGSTLEQEAEGIKQGLLWPYMESLRSYHCPGDTRTVKLLSWGYRSFSIAGGMNGEEREWSNSAVLTYSEINNPAEKYVFVPEVDPRGYNMGSWIVSHPPSNSWIDPIAAWHDGKSTLGWTDGHVTSHKWLDQSTIYWARRAAIGAVDIFYKTPPAGEGQDLKFMQDHYQIQNNN